MKTVNGELQRPTKLPILKKKEYDKVNETMNDINVSFSRIEKNDTTYDK